MRVEKESSLERESAQRARTPDPLLIRLRHLLAPTPFVPKTRPVGHRETIDLSAPRLASLSVLKTCVCGTRPASVKDLDAVIVHQLDRIGRGKSAIFEDFLSIAGAAVAVWSVVDGLLTSDTSLDRSSYR
jgi:hypothetical protein